MRAAALTALVVAGLAAGTEGAGAEDTTMVFLSGDKLFAACNSPEIAPQGICAGFVAAASDAVISLTTAGGSYRGFRACMPKGVSVPQARDVVIQHLQAHPEDRHMTAISLAAEALARAWPCTR